MAAVVPAQAALPEAGVAEAGATGAGVPWQYPATRTVDVVHHYGPVMLADPFAWLEEPEQEEVEQWFRDQDEFARGVLGRISGRDEIWARIREIDEAKEVNIFSFQRVGDRYFYLKQEVGEEVGILYYRDGLAGEERRLLDPADLARGDGVYAIQNFRVAPAGDRVAVAIAASGSEIPDIYIMEVASGEFSDAVIPRARSGASWSECGTGFFYNQLRPFDPAEPRVERFKRTRVRWHELGSDPADDPIVVSSEVRPDLGISDVDSSFIVPVHGTPWTLLFVSHGVDRSATLFYAVTETMAGAATRWHRISERADQIESITFHGDHVFLLSSKDAPRREILHARLSQTGAVAHAGTLVAQSERVLTGFSVVGGNLLIVAMDGGIDRLSRIDLSAEDWREEEIELPTIGRVALLGNDWRRPEVFISLTSWIHAPAWYVWDPAIGSIEPVDLRPRGPFDSPDNLVVERHMVRSHDGVMVPLTIIYQEGLVRDGTAPALLYGYGAYGNPIRPSFSPLRLAWFERGAVYAVAHVRGGGEFGREWHKGGHLERKRNSWLDFHACAEFLIAQGFTSPQHLGAQGGSMGGVLVGRAMTSRPDLYGAIVSNVGNHNPVRNHRRANGPANFPEYGNPLDPEEFPYVLAMDSYFAVQDGVNYPPMLLLSGFNDARVDPWMPGKKAARLQQANPAGGPYLKRVEFRAGHGGVARSDILLQLADTYAFLFWQLGDPDFVLLP